MEKKSTLIKVPAVAFRRIGTPSDDTIGRSYVAIARVADLPKELENWRSINPRDPKLTSGVAKAIRNTLESQPELFLYRNRGLTILAERVEFDNQTNMLKIELSEEIIHGLLDGGHTYYVIRDFIEGLDESEIADIDAMVRIELLEGIQDRDAAISIVESRNTSTQVKEQGIEELRNTFKSIKQAVKGQLYAERIAYKEHELLEDGSKKDIDVKEILSYLICFDTESFGRSNHPIKSYSTKSSLVPHFSDRKEEMRKYTKLLPEILALRDKIYQDLPDAYNKNANDGTGGDFGRLTGVTYTGNKKRMADVHLEFSGVKSNYRIPSGFIYPILASFRNLVRVKPDGACEWKDSPERVWGDLKADLAVRVGNQAKSLQNPNKLGKDVATWQSCYDAVSLEVLSRRLD